ncbi:exosome complex endonuclease 2/ribosomal RNA processing protein-like protein [Xylona heveae TC161]|uniref:Exosome complex component RRP45 n=1 Tax=Xylona heveae (strain CBS 132557 / TC161) TaxID=1328760 RepID=A0A165FXE1_XYLHT|nr:exosome complex endonuclease 2/ribosomal RNA processing protein-like protein [Xylona heveae TC161]KZF21499.1 exosome complex endonuclease 2/ribosomal RNA processing protein-like protein [Xylona heveae TC161]
MPREAEPSLNERAFVLQALQEDIRIDGRALDEFRGIDLKFGPEYGVADVRLGKTRVIARISAEVTTPFPDRKFDGVFTIVTELSPLASPAFEVGRQTEQEVILSRILEKAIRRSNALDTEALCLIAGQAVWSIRADVHVVDHDGGLVDASCIAVMAALKHFRRPDATVSGEGHLTVFTMAERVPVPLSLMHDPLCVSFSFYHGGEVSLVDATLQEEQLREGELIISMNRHGEVCQLAKLGGVPVDALTLLSCTNTALVKVKDLTALINKKLDEDAKRRNLGGLMTELSAENER